MSPTHTQVTPCGRTSVHETRSCELRDLLDRLADKWSLLVVELLGGGTRRFSELQREIDGISQRMLTLTVRRLERDGLVRRTVHPVVPPRVDYELTPLGSTLLDAMEPLVEWSRAHGGEVAAARAGYDDVQSADALRSAGAPAPGGGRTSPAAPPQSSRPRPPG